jgi:hypothetical protein
VKDPNAITKPKSPSGIIGKRNAKQMQKRQEQLNQELCEVASIEATNSNCAKYDQSMANEEQLS